MYQSVLRDKQKSWGDVELKIWDEYKNEHFGIQEL